MPRIYARHRKDFLVEFDDVSRDKIDTAIDWLLQHEFQPDMPGDGWRRTPDGEPICPRHHAVMTRRERQGDVWHSHKITDPQTGDERYCRGFQTSSKADGYES